MTCVNLPNLNLALLLLPFMAQAANYSAQKLNSDGFEVVKLTDAAHHTEVTIVPSVGNNAYSMTVNGKPVRSMSWDARDPQGEIKLHCHIMSGKEDKPALVFVWGSPAGEKKYERELKQILEDVRSG